MSVNFRVDTGILSSISDTSAATHDLNPHDAEPTPASTNVDFITAGRSNFADVSIGALLASKDAYTEKAQKDAPISGLSMSADDANTGGFSSAARTVEASYLQSLIPTKEQVFQMFAYHERHMLCWSGGIYHAPSFRRSLQIACGESERLDLQTVDWLWTALLFSIISASIISSPEPLSASWGYSSSDKTLLAKEWGSAIVSCLQLGNYASKYHIHSIQAILNMHAAEHLVGSAKVFAVYHNAAIIIARGLGLHRYVVLQKRTYTGLSAHEVQRLGLDPDDGCPNEFTLVQREKLIEREIGRRIWYALATQDWLCSTSLGLYNIQKKHFTTIKPRYYHEETMTVVTDGTPTFTHHGNYMSEAAYLLVCYHDDMLDAQDLSAKYSVVLKHDAILRAFVQDRMPAFLSVQTPYDHNWPPWVAWMRHMYQASWAHKIIMMHQLFLGRSFKQPQYTYSRWACCSAARTIVEQLCHERGPEEPQWWVNQAILVTAGTVLALDVFHRSEGDPEAASHLGLIRRTIGTLEGWAISSIAKHGIRLLNSLLQEYGKKNETMRSDSAPVNRGASIMNNTTPRSTAVASSEPAQAQQEMMAENMVLPEMPYGWGELDFGGIDDFMATLPMDTGMDNSMWTA